jgi:hypothetical protein
MPSHSSGTFQPLLHRSGTLRERLHSYTKKTLGAGGSINEAVRFLSLEESLSLFLFSRGLLLFPHRYSVIIETVETA